MDVHAIIPVRLASRRFPRKALYLLDGKPLLQWLVDSVQRSQVFDSITVTSQDREVLDFAKALDVRTCEVNGSFRNGTMRVARAADVLGLNAGAVVNIQGDMPGVDADGMRGIVASLRSGNAGTLTLARPCTDERERADRNRVKVVCNDAGNALYFSRAPIPHAAQYTNTLIHVGVYGFGPGSLARCARCKPSRLAELEDLEQLDWLSEGVQLKVSQSRWAVPSLDSTSDVANVLNWLREEVN
jgi:3-deoxy-manno-octulosonate cytidylyltransferase (CMP-KDO synthetase)